MSSAHRPIGPPGRPCVNLVQCEPPSVDRYRALPGPPPLYPKTVRRCWYVVAYRMFGLCGSIAISLAPVSSFTYRVSIQVAPPSVLLYTPRSLLGPHRSPCAATYTI